MILLEIAGLPEPIKQKDVVKRQRAKLKKMVKNKRTKASTHDEIKNRSLKTLTATLSNIHK